MNRYKIKIDEVTTTEFELNANNKKEAKDIIRDIIFKTDILKLNCIPHTKTHFMTIEKLRKGCK